MTEQGKKYKKQTARENRQKDKVVASGGDDKVRHSSKKGGRNCGGWVGRRGCGERITKESLKCDTCKRRFCDTECHDSHKELCSLKASKNREAIESWAKRVYDKYINENGLIRNPEEREKNKNFLGLLGFSMFTWQHRDLYEASEILKKIDAAYFRGQSHPYIWPPTASEKTLE